MKSKTYPQYEEPKLMAAEPAVAYQRTDPATYRPGTASRSCKQEEPAKLDDEWLRPFTMEELHRRMDEAEADDEEDNLLSSEEVFAYMERKYPWLCK
ncbi:MAG: hypothetical protein IJZ86_04705 [Bacteroides sp.]|nr:hypothetical protein [Bacteroides sp.]